MGSMVTAECEKCDFSTKLLLGGGFADRGALCAYPACCDDCKNLVCVNIKDKSELCCPDCNGNNVILYSDERMQETPGKDEVFDWCYEEEKSATLNSGAYLCPKCGELALFFQECGNWD